MSVKSIRRWYAVYRIGDCEPSYLISALSIEQVESWLESNSEKCVVMFCKVWQFMKVMSGLPEGLGDIRDFAQNHWRMVNDGINYYVVILS